MLMKAVVATSKSVGNTAMRTFAMKDLMWGFMNRLLVTQPAFRPRCNGVLHALNVF